MSPRSSQEKVRAEAHAWLTRLKDAHTSADRDAFEQWLSHDPSHRSFYEQAAAAYDASGVLRTSEVGRARDLRAHFRMRRGAVAAFAGLGAAALAIMGVVELGHGFGAIEPAALESVMLATGTNGRTVKLVDGSELSMAPASQVRIDLGRDERLAEVRQGHVRLTVAPEDRPFRIVAGTASAKVSSGVFEATSVQGKGRILETGKPSTHFSASAGGRITQQPLEFQNEPLGRAVMQINALHSGPPIQLDSSLADRRLSGVFQRGNSEAIAQSLAVAFNLKLTTTPKGLLLLER